MIGGLFSRGNRRLWWDGQDSGGPAARATAVKIRRRGTEHLLRQVLDPLSLDSGLLVVVDLSRATFIDAAVLTALRGAEQAVTGRGGRFGLLPGTAPAVLRMLDLTGWLRRPCVITADNAGSWGFLATRAAW
jgi:anti-anti-sigma regulatory factor